MTLIMEGEKERRRVWWCSIFLFFTFLCSIHFDLITCFALNSKSQQCRQESMDTKIINVNIFPVCFYALIIFRKWIGLKKVSPSSIGNIPSTLRRKGYTSRRQDSQTGHTKMESLYFVEHKFSEGSIWLSRYVWHSSTEKERGGMHKWCLQMPFFL